jgi:hypothetical protein
MKISALQDTNTTLFLIITEIRLYKRKDVTHLIYYSDGFVHSQLRSNDTTMDTGHFCIINTGNDHLATR